MSANNLPLHPPWRQAVNDIVQQFTYGDIISLNWLDNAFGITRPNVGTKAQFRACELEFLANIDPLRVVLQNDHLIYLESVRGIGYRLVEPAEQTPLVWKKMARGVRKHLRQGLRGLATVNHARLTTDEQRENRDALNRMAALNSMNRRRLR